MVLLGVNGGLMRGLYANQRMHEAGCVFVREAKTEAAYRLWSVNDTYPAMIRTEEEGKGAQIAVELWEVPTMGMEQVLIGEPKGLCVGKIVLEDGTETLGVLGEPYITTGMKEITKYGGWRAYGAPCTPK
mmetsp:Transcript_3255/g.9264  ORF Transcript_3255/g.9264 Transcript_3255/m.9264 type:complete len:130 (+) Transcript_3255:318-707(+)|eukprot:CAMPEP_0117664210 /NCGR_PEP_ID=MMETSP0804-20121206/9083_1 /TAXON_ID=1074897 /ORGANISM="Tetraselmis astigmatica, Strain CCMP880" /LENGTH=129 /DNA_ID=CAMNT_0005471397 /DNA_START=373 /DNA_END=762 /DNA_ORIENTATION=-